MAEQQQQQQQHQDVSQDPKTHFLVLISVDESEQAEAAFDCAYMSAEILEGLIQEERRKAKQLEQKFANKLKEHNLSGRIKTIFYGRAGEAIVDEATKESVNMIVIGTRGLGRVRRTVLGSVSDYVLHHVHCPVVICRQ